jgi:hypothetical protein
VSSLLRRKDPEEQAFLERILEHCREVGVSVRSKNSKELGKRQRYSGVYIGADKVIWVARKHRMWFEVLVHEYCHLLQDLDWKAGKREGKWFMDPKLTWMWPAWDSWITNQRELSAETATKCTRAMQAMELDCERRALKFLRLHRFRTVDLKHYICQSNAYIWSYEAARLTRRWSNRRRPYKVREIERMMPDRLIAERDLGRLPEGYLVAYSRECVKA